MNPNAKSLWPGPQWLFSVLLALLGMLGPFSIDTYLPAFAGIAQSLSASPLQMQQTLSAYLFGFAVMSLFHGSLSDGWGRRPVVLWGLAVFTIASIGCALSQTIEQLIFFRTLQGLSTGAGIVVSRAVIRDMYAPAQAQKIMSQVTLFFGIAPAIAPLVGGWLLVHMNWHAIFWFLTGIGIFLWFANYFLLPETLHQDHRQPIHFQHLLKGYWKLGSDPRFILLALASGIPFNGMFLYILSAPVFLGEILLLQPQQFFWCFLITIAGIMGGAFVSGKLAGKKRPVTQIRYGFIIMLSVGLLNLFANYFFIADVKWALFPLGVFSFGWALMVPAVTLLVLDLHPERRGMSSSLQMFISSIANGCVAGLLAPLVMHSAIALAWASLMLMSIGGIAWIFIRRTWKSIGV